jgi:uncharacterized protein YggE
MFDKVSPNVKFVTAALAVAFAVDFLFPYAAPPSTGIAARGECTRKVAKDRSRMRLRIYDLDKDKAAASARAIATYERLVSLVESKGGDLEIDTDGMSVSEKREWNERLKKNELVGVAASITVSVDGNDRSKFAEILAATGKFKDVLVESYGAYASREVRLEAAGECIAEASAMALRQAEYAAAGAGVRIDGLVSAEVSEDGGGFRPLMLRGAAPAYAKAEADDGASSFGIVQGDEKVSVVVEAVYGVY